jgi:hypothetical protein
MRKIVLPLAAIAVVALVVGLYLFEPWRLFTESRVDEGLPTADGEVPSSVPTRTPGETPPSDEPKPEIVELAAGRFEDAEHDTSGRARVLELADGTRFVRLEDLASSDGPDLHVWITDQPSGGDWGSYDDGRYVKLGDLKATHGNQNYEIPKDADLGGLISVVIWCDRFNVAFGTAPVKL